MPLRRAHLLHPRFRPRMHDGRLGESLPVIREVVCYRLPGFVIHRHVILPDDFTVSHFSTGVEIASGSTPVFALRALIQVIRRQKRRWGMRSGQEILARGIAESSDRIRGLIGQ